LGLEGRAKFQEILSQFWMVSGGVVTRVLDDALSDSQREVEAAMGCVSLFEPCDDAQCVQIMVKAKAMRLQRLIERLLARVAKGRVADVVGEREGLCKLCIQAEGIGEGAGDLSNFKRMREPAAEVIAGGIGGQAGKHLRLAGQTSKCPRVQDASAVACKWAAVWMRRFVMYAAGELSVSIHGYPGRELASRFGI